MADPLTALGFASSLAQLVDFAWKLFEGSQAIYKSAAGCSKNNEVLQFIADDLNRLSARVESSPVYEAELRALAERAKQVTKELLGLLATLQLRGEKTKWGSFVLALKEVCHRDRVKELYTRVSMLQNQLSMHVQMMLRYDGLFHNVRCSLLT